MSLRSKPLESVYRPEPFLRLCMQLAAQVGSLQETGIKFPGRADK